MTYLGEHFAGTPYGKLYAEHTPDPAGDSHVSR